MEYRILPVQVQGHGLKDEKFLSDPHGFELFRRDGIRLVSMGIFPSEEDAKKSARAYSGNEQAIFI